MHFRASVAAILLFASIASTGSAGTAPVPVFIDLKCDNELLASRIRAEIAKTLRSLEGIVVTAEEARSVFVIRLVAVRPVVGGETVGVAMSYAFTDWVITSDKRIIPRFLGGGVLCSGESDEDLKRVIGGMVGQFDENVTTPLLAPP